MVKKDKNMHPQKCCRISHKIHVEVKKAKIRLQFLEILFRLNDSFVTIYNLDQYTIKEFN